MRLPRVVELRAMRSASSAPPWLNMSSNDCRRAASISRTASPRVPMVSASDSALSRKVSLTLLPRSTMVSVMREPVCSIFATTSPPRSERSSTSESPVVLSEELTSSTRLEIASASWLPVSTTSSVSCWVRPVIMSRIAADFCEKPSATRSRRTDIMCWRLAAISVNSSPMWSVLKLSVAVRRSVAWAIASAVLEPVASSRSSRSPPRSPSCSIMLSPAWPSARVMCSPFSASVMVMRRAASLTCSATSWLICEMSWLRSRCTPLMASRICSACPTSVSRWPPRSCNSARMRTSLSL